MRIRKTGWAVWDKKNQRFVKRSGCYVFPDQVRAWLIAEKERKDSPYKVVRVEIKIAKQKP